MTTKIEPFWNKKYGKDVICPITHTRLRSGQNKDGISHTITTICKHTFYRSALNTWLIKNNNCPVCRTKL